MRTILEITPTQDLYVLTELNQGSTVSILLWQNKPVQSAMTNSPTQAISSVVING